jgi:hypothetical protein
MRAVAMAGAVLEWSDVRDESRTWLVGRTLDLWLACAGGGGLLLIVALVLHWHGDRELSTADLLLGELHLGATYDAVVRGRLWRRMPLEVLAMPVAISAATYALMLRDLAVVVTTVVLYVAVWHRARTEPRRRRWYQVRMGGPVSTLHRRLFRAAIYLPMAAGASTSRTRRRSTKATSTSACRRSRARRGARPDRRRRRRGLSGVRDTASDTHPSGRALDRGRERGSRSAAATSSARGVRRSSSC